MRTMARVAILASLTGATFPLSSAALAAPADNPSYQQAVKTCDMAAKLALPLFAQQVSDYYLSGRATEAKLIDMLDLQSKQCVANVASALDRLTPEQRTQANIGDLAPYKADLADREQRNGPAIRAGIAAIIRNAKPTDAVIANAVADQRQKLDACDFKRSSDKTMPTEQREAIRKTLQRPDRAKTASMETTIQHSGDAVRKCLADYTTAFDRQPAALRQAPAMATLRQEADRRVGDADASVRAYFTALGYRPSSAPPAPVFFVCQIDFEYEPPLVAQSGSTAFLSAIGVDPASDDKPSARADYSRVQQRFLDDFGTYLRGRYKTPSNIDVRGCFASDTRAEAEAELLERKNRDSATLTNYLPSR